MTTNNNFKEGIENMTQTEITALQEIATEINKQLAELKVRPEYKELDIKSLGLSTLKCETDVSIEYSPLKQSYIPKTHIEIKYSIFGAYGVGDDTNEPVNSLVSLIDDKEAIVKSIIDHQKIVLDRSAHDVEKKKQINAVKAELPMAIPHGGGLLSYPPYISRGF